MVLSISTLASAIMWYIGVLPSAFAICFANAPVKAPLWARPLATVDSSKSVWGLVNTILCSFKGGFPRLASAWVAAGAEGEATVTPWQACMMTTCKNKQNTEIMIKFCYLYACLMVTQCGLLKLYCIYPAVPLDQDTGKLLVFCSQVSHVTWQLKPSLHSKSSTLPYSIIQNKNSTL